MHNAVRIPERFEFFEHLGLKTSSTVRKFEVPFTKSTIRSFLKNLANTGAIQAQQIEGKRDKRYFANRGEELKYIELEIVGYYIQHYDKKKLLDNILERYSDNEMSSQQNTMRKVLLPPLRKLYIHQFY